ncbi:hypothetical protein [Endozoicomonas sp. Mp262]|uniref:hypothetical protein n=1 Tax=Endozoicomonas sp. Mp262 TaxID=2919499 RepID=UPI0021DF6830
MMYSPHTLKQVTHNVVATPDAASTVRGIPAMCRNQTVGIITACKPMLVDTAIKAGSAIRGLSDYSIQSLAYLNAHYNPVGMMMRSHCAYIREPTCWLKNEVDSAFLYFLKKPKRFAKLMVALGIPVPPETMTALMLEDSAEKLENFTPEGFEKLVVPDKFLGKSEDKTKAKILLTLLTAPGKDIDKLCQSLNDSVKRLFGLSSAKNLYLAIQNKGLSYLRTLCMSHIASEH